MTDTKSQVYRLAFQKTANPAVVTDKQFRIIEVNEACLRLSGFAREELLGETPLALLHRPETYAEAAEKMMAGETWVGDFEATTKDGRLRTVQERQRCLPEEFLAG
ncbi:MAG: PAS domain S-box protein, partial [Halobacteriota archaeon]